MRESTSRDIKFYCQKSYWSDVRRSRLCARAFCFSSSSAREADAARKERPQTHEAPRLRLGGLRVRDRASMATAAGPDFGWFYCQTFCWSDLRKSTAVVLVVGCIPQPNWRCSLEHDSLIEAAVLLTAAEW